MTSIEPNSTESVSGTLGHREVQLCHYLRFQALLDQGGKEIAQMVADGLNLEIYDDIIEVVHKVPGVSKVHSEIVIGTSLYAGDLNRPRS